MLGRFYAANGPKKLEDMLPQGGYEGKLALMTRRGSPIPIPINFDIDSSRRAEYEEGICRIELTKINETC